MITFEKILKETKFNLRQRIQETLDDAMSDLELCINKTFEDLEIQRKALVQKYQKKHETSLHFVIDEFKPPKKVLNANPNSLWDPAEDKFLLKCITNKKLHIFRKNSKRTDKAIDERIRFYNVATDLMPLLQESNYKEEA